MMPYLPFSETRHAAGVKAAPATDSPRVKYIKNHQCNLYGSHSSGIVMAVSQVLWSHKAQPRDWADRMEGLYGYRSIAPCVLALCISRQFPTLPATDKTNVRPRRPMPHGIVSFGEMPLTFQTDFPIFLPPGRAFQSGTESMRRC